VLAAVIVAVKTCAVAKSIVVVPVVSVPNAETVTRTPVNTGVVPNTSAPDPVSSETAAAKLAEDGVPSQVATPVPSEVMPVPPLATGKAVPLKLIANVPDVVTGEPATLKNAGTLAATLVTVPPLEGEVLVIVKLGYVPVVDMPVPAVKDTVWSGAVLVIVRVPLVVIGLPEIEMPVLAVAATLVTVPVLLVLLLNVFQSVLVKYPLTLVVAAAMLIAGVVPPEETTGAVPVTEVIVPPLDGEVLVIVKLGYVPLVDIPEPAVRDTV